MFNFKKDNQEKYPKLYKAIISKDISSIEEEIHNSLLYNSLNVITENEPDNPFECVVNDFEIFENENKILLEVLDDGSNEYKVILSEQF